MATALKTVSCGLFLNIVYRKYAAGPFHPLNSLSIRLHGAG